VVAWRIPRGESIVSPRSRCPRCGEPVRPRDNIPIVSWLMLRGRCRFCGEPISRRYPAIEAFTAVAFGAVVVARGVDWDLLWQLPLVALLVAVAAIDLEHQIIPNRILVPAAVWGVVSALVVRAGDLPELVAWGAGAFLFFLLAALAYPAGMGMGDVKLAGVLGLYLGSSVVPALFIAFLTGSIYGVGVMIRTGAGGRKHGVPFGPFLALGAFVGLLAGPDLVDLYRDNFL
jgi:leader peptidase (prepilin peptidase)/N-methyltransferase